MWPVKKNKKYKSYRGRAHTAKIFPLTENENVVGGGYALCVCTHASMYSCAHNNYVHYYECMDIVECGLSDLCNKENARTVCIVYSPLLCYLDM